MSDAMEELRAVFRDEAGEALDELARLLERLALPAEDAGDDDVHAAMRVVHNVKGAARIAGLSSIETLTHAMEDGLGACRKAGELPDATLLGRLGRAITAILKHLEGRAEEAELLALAKELGAEVGEAEIAPGPSWSGSGGRATVRVETDRLDRLMGFSGEFLSLHGRMAAKHGLLQALEDDCQALRSKAPIEVRGRLNELGRRLEELVRGDRHELQRFGYLAGDLAAAAKQVRMQPVEQAVAGWRQTVAEAAQELGKEARLEAKVGAIELDRQVLDGLRDPMMHLLRNAVAHGVEPPEERERLGKPRTATVQIRARTVGTMVELEVGDDGAGIDPDRVSARAVEQGVLPAEQAAELDAAGRLDLIFRAGISTASEVTRVSGRGVGLDVVRGRVTALGGRAEVLPREGGGVRFRLTVPVTLVSTKGLLVRTERGTYALPLVHVVRTLRVESARVRPAGGGTAIEQPDAEPIRLRWLASIMQERREPDPDKLSVVLISHGAATVGLVVSEVLGETEFVTKRLPWTFRRVPGVAGAVILGDGTVALVVEVPHLFTAVEGGVREEGIQQAERRAAMRVLVVDDSLTSRTLERNILRAAGYEVEVAVDGQAAWDLLQRTPFDLVVSDVQMPQLDGIELTRRIRSHPKMGELPVVLVTSMDTPEDIAAGSEAGADEYIVKGQFDQRVLLDAVARLL